MGSAWGLITSIDARYNTSTLGLRMSDRNEKIHLNGCPGPFQRDLEVESA